MPPGMGLLEFIRNHQSLKGSKLVCKEGECGACTVLVGGLQDGELRYRSMTSCIMPLANAHHKHIVTIEGLNMEALNPVQQAMVDTNGTQCGFCTPGFVVAMTGGLMRSGEVSLNHLTQSIDGNICRCTGYKSIERAAEALLAPLKTMPQDHGPRIPWLIQQGYIPAYFSHIKNRLAAFGPTDQPKTDDKHSPTIIGGGSDLMVQRPRQIESANLTPVFDQSYLKGIQWDGDFCEVGAATTITELAESAIFQSQIPDVQRFAALFASHQLRNMSTIGGNIANASPIGDSTMLFLGLDSEVVLEKEGARRIVKLRDFFLGYKQMDKKEGELILAIRFPRLPKGAFFNFEKVSKRTYFDIASVNTACQIVLDEKHLIKVAHIAAGGVGPIPLYLTQTSHFLIGKELTFDTLKEALKIANEEASPISDARGSAAYKRLLLRQLIIAHFVKMSPELVKPAQLLILAR